jgi:hypothetical protein
MRLGGLHLQIGPGSNASATVEMRTLMTPLWLEAALCHLISAESHATIVASHVPAEQRTSALEREFLSAMQSIVAAATAIDALYSCAKPCVKLPPQLVETWKKNRTARPAQVVETLRIAFKLRPKTVGAMKPTIEDLYKFRDWAVHPNGDYKAPEPHPTLGTAVEWRYVAFSARNAKPLTRCALAWATLVARKAPAGASKLLVDLCDGLSRNLGAVGADWRARYGRLTDDPEIEADTPPAR